jgi:hypothetical protein
MSFNVGDKKSVLFTGLSGFWHRFFKDAPDLEAYYQASEVYLGQVYLDLLSSVLSVAAVDTPIFNKEYWKLFTLLETELDIKAGAVEDENRYVYDMPGEIVNVDFLQNTILAPEILLERDLDFDVLDNDGLIRFHDDPFNAYQDVTGKWMPIPGLAWRTLRVAVGNAIQDTSTKMYRPTQSYFDTPAERGDTLRILAYRGDTLREGLTGSLANTSTLTYFYGADAGLCKVGDVIHIHAHSGGQGHVDDTWLGFYIVKETSTVEVDRVVLEPLTVPDKSFSSTTDLQWIQYRAIYFGVDALNNFVDYELDYYEGSKGVGPADNPYPLDLTGPVVYSIVRDVIEPDVIGVNVVFQGLPTSDFDPPALPTPVLTILGRRHIVPGSVLLRGYKVKREEGHRVNIVEGEDYSVDYLRGVIYQTQYWDEASLGKCDYQYKEEMFLSGAGDLEEYPVGNVRQLSFWVPEVQVDRFTLWYNFGSLLNRFDASSEAYKAFLMGIMYLYMTGPILQRIEAALNVAAEYPVVKQDGEILVSYDNGVNSSGIAANLDGISDEVTLLEAEHSFDEQDVGGFIVFSNPLSEANRGKFSILSINTSTNSALLKSTYGLVTETDVSWEISHTYTKQVVTDYTTYVFPFDAPVREDIIDSANWNSLTFEIFEPLTIAFLVTDYLEDPGWWHNKVIPPMLWPDTPTRRRRATTLLHEHIIGAEDDPLIGDPGLFIGADETGVVYQESIAPPVEHDINTIFTFPGVTVAMLAIGQYMPDAQVGETVYITNATYSVNNGSFTIDGVGGSGSWLTYDNGSAVLESPSTATATLDLPVPDYKPIHRHGVAFILFDRYLKMHMFYVEFYPDLELDEQFKSDLEELILVAKPSYTYPMVEPNEIFIDNVLLTDDFNFGSIAFDFTQAMTDGIDSGHLADNGLLIGDDNFPWTVGDMYKYEWDVGVTTPATYANPLPIGTIFTVPDIPTDAALLTLSLDAARADGKLPIEGRDYTVNWLREDPAGTPNPDAWQVETLTELTLPGGDPVAIDCVVSYAERLNGAYDTTLGWTPVNISGDNPWYIRLGALDPSSPSFTEDWAAIRTEFIDRPVQLTIEVEEPPLSGTFISYTYV